MAGVISIIIVLIRPRKRNITVKPISGNYRRLLTENVQFYQKLDEEGKKNFEVRMQHFVSGIRITGVSTIVEDIDRLLIGASAIIPLYAFPDWEYINLNEVLLYPETFSEEFEQEGRHRFVGGMVGSGTMQKRNDFFKT